MTSACFSRANTGFSRNATLVAKVNPPALAGGVFNFAEPSVALADIKDFKSSYQEINEPDPLPDAKHAVLYIYAVGNENPNLENLYITLNKKASHVI